MPCSSHTGELQFNLEIEKTARRLRKETKQRRIRAKLDIDLTVGGGSIFEEIETEMATNIRRTIQELNALNSDQQPLATHLRKEIYEIKQLNGELLYEYWERFKELVASYLHHQFTESLLIQYFYERLSGMDRRMVDAASRRVLIDKTPYEAQHSISTMAENYRQYGYHTDRGAPRVN
ncbi:UNVERIFIED_CONTAM: hypothetical protein Sradi_2631300 [Sesamum radiatum]|uniref:Retrotransposon gag domain-containing protein n=1 Tax=Sesamum radiatum TaxID=300843 RepID=A0AAW2S5Y4_SESRA